MLVKKRKGRWGIILMVIIVIWLISMTAAKMLDYNIRTGDKIAVIPVIGVITLDGGSITPFGEATISANVIAKKIEQAGSNKNIKAVVLEIDSPGGTVIATEEVAKAVKKLDKPAVAWIRQTGASGAYWIASAADAIVADPFSVTGSIGVTSSYLEFAGLFNRYGIVYRELTAGRYKDIGSSYKELRPDEKKLLQEKLDMVHEAFIDEVAKNRKLEREQVEGLANGMFYLGKEAYELGLVDYLGDKETAVDVAKKLANIKKAELVSYKPKQSWVDVLRRLTSEASFYVGQGIASGFRLEEDFELMV